jgi:hypothetical protein
MRAIMTNGFGRSRKSSDKAAASVFQVNCAKVFEFGDMRAHEEMESKPV